jgi:hypothetical protein
MNEGTWSTSWPADGGGDESEDRLRLSDIGKLARRTRRRIVGAARADDRPTFPKLLTAHLGSIDDVEVVEESWPSYDQVNVQVGLDAWLAEGDRDHTLVGLTDFRHRSFGLGDLMRSQHHEYGPFPGTVAWTNLSSGPEGQVRQAVRAGLYLVVEGDVHAALLVLSGDPEEGSVGVRLHVAADVPGRAAGIAAEVRASALHHNVFRGQVVSFDHDMFGERGAVLQFHTRSDLSADDVILPAEVLATIRRQVVGVADHRERLLAARQHLKRGLLLYGPPGVGKTHTLRYLIGQLTDVALHLIGTACSVARTLQPSMVVVEDVDLIAEDREIYGGGHSVLFQLLNEMDGLAEDADVVFVLTTNRPAVLESALAARPGRVDQAVALELPDAEARRRLFRLYQGGLEVDASRLDAVVERTDGVTASFLKELLRRGALLAAQQSRAGPIVVSADQLDAALDELLDTRNAMTRVLLGGRNGEVPTVDREAHHSHWPD